MQFPEMNAATDRAAQHAEDASAKERCTVLAMQAAAASVGGEIDEALDFLVEIHKIPENELTASVLGFAANCEGHVRFQAGQMDLCEAAARKATRILEQSGDVWLQADIEYGVYFPALQCGRPAEAEKLVLEANPRAVRIGRDSARLVGLTSLAHVYVAKGDLESAERTAREALAFGESSQVGFISYTELALGGILLYRDQTEEALALLSKAAAAPPNFLSGGADAMLAWGMTATGMDGAADACTAAVRFLPRPGTSRGYGAWLAVLSLTGAFCLSGRREEAGRLKVEAEKIAAEWDISSHCFPARTAAGIAAACAGDWARSEEHHRAAIERMDAVPYVTAQPIARYWYADMLAERGGAGDVDAAKAMLQESIAASEKIGLALYARLARQRLAQLA